MAAIADGLLVMVAIALRIAGGIYLDSLPHVLAIMAQNHGQILRKYSFCQLFCAIMPICWN